MTTEAFITALLLTRSPRLAEYAVLKAIERSDCSAESVLRETIAESLKVDIHVSQREVSAASAILSAELRWLLALRLLNRRCFVLSFLTGLTREQCAQALHIEHWRVDQEIVEALMNQRACVLNEDEAVCCTILKPGQETQL